MIRIGVTGGIGSGKSVVCELVELLGFKVYYSDSKAKELMTTDRDVVYSVKQLFGDNAYNDNGEINKKLIASVIFSDKEILTKINSIVHPAVKNDFGKWADSLAYNDLVFIESAILVESNLLDEIDKLVVMSSPKEIRIERIIKRDNITKAQAEARMAVQMSQEELCSYADYIIYSDDKQLIIPQVISIIGEIIESIRH